jgi:hypothetical protein
LNLAVDFNRAPDGNAIPIKQLNAGLESGCFTFADPL